MKMVENRTRRQTEKAGLPLRMTQDIEDNESETQIGFDNGNDLLDDDNVLGGS